MSNATGSRSSAHQTATESLYSRKLVRTGPTKIEKIFRELNLSYIKDTKAAKALLASQGGKEFLGFWEQSRAANAPNYPERSLEEDCEKMLKNVIEHHDGANPHVVERQRTLDDSARTDLIVSSVKTDNALSRAGRPSFLLELKAPEAKFGLALHQHQVVHYVQELLSRHVSVSKLPFAIFNGHQYYVGLANWKSYAELAIDMEETLFICQTEY